MVQTLLTALGFVEVSSASPDAHTLLMARALP